MHLGRCRGVSSRLGLMSAIGGPSRERTLGLVVGDVSHHRPRPLTPQDGPKVFHRLETVQEQLSAISRKVIGEAETLQLIGQHAEREAREHRIMGKKATMPYTADAT